MRGREIMEYKLEVTMVNFQGEYEFAFLRYNSLNEVFDSIKTFVPIKFYAVESYKIVIEDN